MSSLKCINNSATKSIDYNRSSAKRLYEYVFKIVTSPLTQIDQDDMEISSFDQYETNGSKIVSLLANQGFLEGVHQKIKN